MERTNINPAPSSSNHLLKQVVIGIGDGLMIGFAITTALSVLYSTSENILPYAFIVILAGGIILGIGGFLSARYRMERLTSRTKDEEEKENALETQKTIRLFQKLDLGKEMQQQAKDEIEKENVEWKTYLEKNKQDFEAPVKKELPLAGFIIGVSFMIGGLLALLPYLFKDEAAQAFHFSLWINLPLLLLTGWIKSKVNGEPLIWGAIRLMLLGAAVAAAAYFVAGIFVR